MKHYDVIFFDIDDTLFDFRTAEGIAFNQTFEEYNLPNSLKRYRKTYNEVSKILWTDLENGNTTLSELGSERFRRLFVEHDLQMDGALFNRDYLHNLGQQSHLVPGAEQVIKALNLANKRLAVITNGYGEVQKSRIKNSPLADAFEHIIISEETGYQKPQREIFVHAFEEMAVGEDEEVLIVGDSLTSDIRGGSNFGIDTCWFNPNGLENQTDVTPTYEIKQLHELLEIIH